MINIFDIGQIYFSQDDIESAKRRNRNIDNFFAGSYLLGALDFLLKFIYFFFWGNKSFPQKQKGKTRVLFYGLSRNNRVTLEPIINVMGDEDVVSFIHQKVFPSWKLYWHAFPHLLDLIREIRKADEKQKKIFKLFFPKFWRMYGCEAVINEMLDIYMPEVVVMANDHQEFNRCLLLICNQRGIKTIYVQHASVGTRFPPLQFTYSLLDGLDAYLKYKNIGDMKGNVYLLGGVRFDEIKPNFYKHPPKTVIGLAINLVDNEVIIKKTCKEIQSLYKNDEKDFRIVLRPHPQMQGDAWKSWCDSNGILFSSPKEESSFEFIGKSSFVVANQCSIHLDTAMCHKSSVIYNMSTCKGEDVYLFKKNGLAKEIENIKNIQRLIDDPNSLKISDEAVRFFNCSYNTKYEGNVAIIIRDLIYNILDNCVNRFNSENKFVQVEGNSKFHVYKIEE